MEQIDESTYNWRRKSPAFGIESVTSPLQATQPKTSGCICNNKSERVTQEEMKVETDKFPFYELIVSLWAVKLWFLYLKPNPMFLGWLDLAYEY